MSVDSYAGTNADVFVTLTNILGANPTGQSFTATHTSLDSARLWLRKVGAPTGNLTARLYAHTGIFGITGTATGSPLATSADVAASTVGETANWVEFTFDGTYEMADGTHYVIAVANSVENSSNYVEAGGDSSSPTHAGTGCGYNSPWWGLLYIGGVPVDMCFEVNGTDVITPPSEVVDEYDETNYTGFLALSSSNAAGQSFTPAEDFSLDSAEFWAKKVSAATGSVYARLYAHTGTFGNGGKPTGTALAVSAPVDASSISTSFGWVEFTFDGSYVMTADTPYCVTVEHSGDYSAYVAAGFDYPSPTHAGNFCSRYGTTWSGSGSSMDAMFRVNGTPDVAPPPPDPPPPVETVVVDECASSNYYTPMAMYADSAPRPIGQSFTGISASLHSVEFWTKKTGAPTGNLVANLYAHFGVYGENGIPSGAALATSAAFDASTLTTSMAFAEFVFDDTFDLVAGEHYVVTVSHVSGSAGPSDLVMVGIDADRPAHVSAHDGNYCSWAAGIWTPAVSADAIFRVNGVEYVPAEPLDPRAGGYVDSYDSANCDTGAILYYASGADRLGQSFRGDISVLRSAEFWLRKHYSPTGTVVAKLYAHTGVYGHGGKPLGEALATSATVVASSLGASYAWTEFVFDGSYVMTSRYYVVAVEYASGDGTNSVEAGYDASSPAHGGNACAWVNPSWSALEDRDVCFRVNGTAVPMSLDFGNGVVAGGRSTDPVRISGFSGLDGPEVALPVSEHGTSDGASIGTSRSKSRLMTVMMSFADGRSRYAVSALFTPGVLRTLTSPRGSIPYYVEIPPVFTTDNLTGRPAMTVAMRSPLAYPEGAQETEYLPSGTGTFDSTSDVACGCAVTGVVAGGGGSVLTIVSPAGTTSLWGTFATGDTVTVSTAGPNPTVIHNGVSAMDLFDRSSVFPMLAAGESTVTVTCDTAAVPSSVSWSPKYMGLVV